MKKYLLSVVLSLLVLTSCTTRVVSSNKPYSDEKLFVGKHYTFLRTDGTKESLDITKIDSENIYGKNVDGREVLVEKSKISEIKKVSAGKTIGLAAGILAIAVLLPAYIQNKPVGQ